MKVIHKVAVILAQHCLTLIQRETDPGVMVDYDQVQSALLDQDARSVVGAGRFAEYLQLLILSYWKPNAFVVKQVHVVVALRVHPKLAIHAHEFHIEIFPAEVASMSMATLLAHPMICAVFAIVAVMLVIEQSVGPMIHWGPCAYANLSNV